jgi:hypothetical protein
VDDWLKVLLGGVVGSLATMVGAFAIELRREDVVRAGSARALFLELAENAEALRNAMKFQRYLPLHESTWRDARLTLSGAVSPEDFATIGHAYSKIRAIVVAEEVTAGSRPDAILGAAPEALPIVTQAGILCLHRGWPKASDRDRLGKRLETITGQSRT